MRLSTRGRYGIQAMYDLASCSAETPQSVKQISERQSIPEAYLEQLFSMLKKADLVRSVRGAQGGYILSRSPSEITIGDILRSLEGNLDLVDCLSDNLGCKRSEECASRLVWMKLSAGLNQLADSITLYDMVSEQRQRIENRRNI